MRNVLYPCAVALSCLGTAGRGRAEPHPLPPSAGDFSIKGGRLAIAPLAATSLGPSGWDSTLGAELLVLRIDESKTLAGFGAALGAASFGRREGGRLWVGALAASAKPPLPVGVQLALATELEPLGAARWGVRAALFLYAGVMPYAEVGILGPAGPSLELGLRAPLPALTW